MPDRVTSGASYGGAFVSVFAGLTLTEWGIVVGILTALATFAVNYWYQQHRRLRIERLYRQRQDDREQEIATAKLEKLRGE